MMKRAFMMKCRIRQFFSWLLILGAIALGFFLGLGILQVPSAAAAIRQLEEAPEQVVYQSRQSLQDQHSHRWQAVAFKRIGLHTNSSLKLRLIGFPGSVEVDRTQPLALTNSLGTTLFAADASDDLFGDRDQPETNIGQYNLQPLLSQLQVEIPLKLTLFTANHEAIRLSVPIAFVKEWQTIAEQN